MRFHRSVCLFDDGESVYRWVLVLPVGILSVTWKVNHVYGQGRNENTCKKSINVYLKFMTNVIFHMVFVTCIKSQYDGRGERSLRVFIFVFLIGKRFLDPIWVWYKVNLGQCWLAGFIRKISKRIPVTKNPFLDNKKLRCGVGSKH